MTLASNHDTPFGHGQPIWKILSISNMGLRSYGPDKDMNMHTVRRTGRQTVRVIPILLHELY